jgi:hypothetical protein
VARDGWLGRLWRRPRNKSQIGTVKAAQSPALSCRMVNKSPRALEEYKRIFARLLNSQPLLDPKLLLALHCASASPQTFLCSETKLVLSSPANHPSAAHHPPSSSTHSTPAIAAAHHAHRHHHLTDVLTRCISSDILSTREIQHRSNGRRTPATLRPVHSLGRRQPGPEWQPPHRSPPSGTSTIILVFRAPQSFVRSLGRVAHRSCRVALRRLAESWHHRSQHMEASTSCNSHYAPLRRPKTCA